MPPPKMPLKMQILYIPPGPRPPLLLYLPPRLHLVGLLIILVVPYVFLEEVGMH